MSVTKEESEDPPGSILVIYNLVEEVVRGEARDLVADQEIVKTAHDIADALAAHIAPVREHVSEALAAYDPRDLLVFNLCENLGGRSQDEAKVPIMLEQLGFHYTGSPAATLALCLNKARTKARLAKHGIPTPPYQVFTVSTAPIKPGLLPAIVKPLAEDASHGIGRHSVARTAAQLREQAAHILLAYRQPALVEAFIDGREFNVSVWGNGAPQVLPLAEIDFSRWRDPYQRVVHYDAKWSESAEEYTTMPVLCPAPVEDELRGQIEDVALRAYRVTGCRDYARVDIRLRDGVPHVLEVNPNPCLAADAGFYNAARAAGYDYAAMAKRIVTLAWQRKAVGGRQSAVGSGRPALRAPARTGRPGVSVRV
jgi:D-alanine-D-alanine ligase